jgi:hypothetical protein
MTKKCKKLKKVMTKNFNVLYSPYLSLHDEGHPKDTHLEFSVQTWSPWTEADKECLEKVQRSAVGMVSGLASRDYEERLRELGHTSLEERRHQLDMQQVHRILVGKDKVRSETWFKMASDIDRETRAAAYPLNLRIPASRLEVRKNFFSQRVPESWNKIPPALKQATTAKAFRNAYQNTGKRELPPDGRQDDDQTSRCGVHDVLTLSERPYLGHGDSSFKYPKYPNPPPPPKKNNGKGVNPPPPKKTMERGYVMLRI